MLCKIDLDLSCMRNYEQRGRYSKLLQYLYPLTCVSPDVTDTLKNIKCLLEICPTSWRDCYLCVLFYGCSSLRPILPGCDPLLCCYLRLVILVMHILVSRLSQT